MEPKRFGKGFEHYTPEEQARIALGREVAAEGMVLLENNGILPLKAGRKVALFGVGQIGFLHGGSGSGSTFADYVVKLPEAMENAGAVVDPYLTALYADYCAQEQKKVEKEPPHMRRGTIPEMVLSDTQIAAARETCDVAVISIARLAGEGRDRKLEPGDYYLSPEEHALFAGVKRHFDHVIVLLNVCGYGMGRHLPSQRSPDGLDSRTGRRFRCCGHPHGACESLRAAHRYHRQALDGHPVL